ncbi:MAG: radical SAM protein [Thermomicrobiales bacterium]
MSRVQYIETPCKTALNRVSGMPFRWSLNPYRGCVHGCHYCYARATHAYLGMNADEDFETRIVVKTNFVEVLRNELARPTWNREQVAIGTATDAYQPCEGRYRITRRVLEALRDYQTPASIVTKSTLVVRDIDVLAELVGSAGVTVFFTITTVDPHLWRLLEPGTPPPAKRLQIARRLSEAGIPVGVFVAPILPGITDSVASIEAVAAAAREHGAIRFGASPLRLAPLVKEHYLDFVARSFPELLHRYQRAYAGTNAPISYQETIERRIAAIRARHGFTEDAMRSRTRVAGRRGAALAAATAPSGQLSLPL